MNHRDAGVCPTRGAGFAAKRAVGIAAHITTDVPRTLLAFAKVEPTVRQ